MNDHSPLRSAWTDSLSRGRHPDAAALRAHLRAVHRDHAGFTERCAQACRDPQGRTSYEWLAEAAAPIGRVGPGGLGGLGGRDEGGRALDLACGSGPLLELLHARNPQWQLIGVDMCPEELALARARLPEGAATLMEAEAQDMAALSDGSVEAVFCHWALTLMDPIAPVLDEVRRVLAPGGRFAALVDGPMDAAPGYAATHDLIYRHVQAELPGYGEIDLGDPRVRGADSLSEMVRAAFPGATITLETAIVAMDGPAEVVAEAAAGFFYAAFVLSPARRARMLAELAATLMAGANAAPARFAMPVNRLLVVT